MLDIGALPGLSRGGRVQALDAWLTGLLEDAVAGTPPPGGPPGAAPLSSDRLPRPKGIREGLSYGVRH